MSSRTLNQAYKDQIQRRDSRILAVSLGTNKDSCTVNILATRSCMRGQETASA